MLNINIKTIPHSEHRYPTCGDYWVDENGVQQVRVSDMNNPDYEILVAIHELIELYLCQKRGIKEEGITAFDVEFENNRVEGNVDEPGDDKNAPYRKEHFFATNVERLLAEQLGVDWKVYSDIIEQL